MAAHNRPIVVPLDGSTNAETAVPFAVHLASAFGAPLRFVRVDPDWFKVSDEQRRMSLGAFERYVSGLLRVYGGQSLTWSSVILPGNAGQAIVEEARLARMIVLATHGQTGLRARFSGSVADQVVRNATVPVLVIPISGSHRIGRGPILVALDGSPLAEAGLAVAREIGRVTEQQLVLLQAWSPVIASTGEFAAASAGVITEIAASVDAYLASVRRGDEETVALAGAPATVIRDAADRLDASMVVVSSHGKGLAMRLAVGSTTDGLRRSLNRPLLVVPAAARERAADGHRLVSAAC